MADLYPPCEVCGEPTTGGVLDTIISEEPFVGDQGDRWPVVSGHGGYRFRCRRHPYYMRHFTRAEFDRMHSGKEDAANGPR